MTATLTLALVMAAGHVDTSSIQKLTGAQGKEGAEGAFRVSVARNDIDVYAGDIKLTPEMGLTAWAAFKRVDKGDLVVGELVLLDDQVDAAVNAALAGGLEITGLDNHFARESPRVATLHFTAQGEEGPLAMAVGKSFDVVRAKTSAAGPQLAQLDAGHKPLDAKKLSGILGAGTTDGGGFQIVKPRGKVTVRGQQLGVELGAASWAAFSGSDSHAAVAGAIAAEDSDLQAVLKALNAEGLSITAIDSPYVGEQPRLRLVHFFAAGTLDKLAQGVKAALAATK